MTWVFLRYADFAVLRRGSMLVFGRKIRVRSPLVFLSASPPFTIRKRASLDASDTALHSRGLVRLFVPYTWKDGRLASSEYDYPGFRSEIPRWFEPLGWRWEWVPVSLEGPPGTRIEAVVASTRSMSESVQTVAFNLCDGSEEDGVPGLSVVRALEESGCVFTGAGSDFYRVSTSKLAMKRMFADRGVPTAPWYPLEGRPEIDVGFGRWLEETGFPLLVKPDVSAASLGIGLKSRVGSISELLECWSRGERRHPVSSGGWFVERFLSGREFTVFVVEIGGEVEAFAPAERVFHPALPPEERFLSRERYVEEYEEESPPPEGVEFCSIAAAPADLRERLRRVAEDAFRAVGGNGYARVDLRTDGSEGAISVLEVNANCGLSFDPDSYTGQILRLHAGDMSEVTGRILRSALCRGKRL